MEREKLIKTTVMIIVGILCCMVGFIIGTYLKNHGIR